MNTVQHPKTLFEKIGGMQAVDAAVEIFYAKVLADDQVSHFFRWTHVRTQIARQKTFLAYAFGAPLPYSGKNLRDAHAHLLEAGLNTSHFDAVLAHLTSTLWELELPEELIGEVMGIAESTRVHVLGQ